MARRGRPGVHQRRLSQTDAAELAWHAAAAGYTTDTFSEALRAVWQARVDQEPVPLSPAAVRDLHHLADVLGLREEAARLPQVSSALKGWRIVPVGTAPEVSEVTTWAALHGATIGERPSKTTRLLIADPDTTAHTMPVNGAGLLPLMTPQAAHIHLNSFVAEAKAVAPARQPATEREARLVITEPALAPVWRPIELPGVLTLGTFTWPVRWLVEQAADPRNPSITLHHSRRPHLTAKRSGLSPEERERLDEALPIVQAKLRTAPPLPAQRNVPAPRQATPAQGSGVLPKLLSRLRASLR